jgi:hypothetical protein
VGKGTLFCRCGHEQNMHASGFGQCTRCSCPLARLHRGPGVELLQELEPFLNEHQVATLHRCAGIAADAATFWEAMDGSFPRSRYDRLARRWRRQQEAYLAEVARLEGRADMLDAATEGSCPRCGGGVCLAGTTTLLCQRCGATWSTAAELRLARTRPEPVAAAVVKRGSRWHR